MKKILLLMTTIFLMVVSVSCSSDDNVSVVKPSVVVPVTEYKNAILGEWKMIKKQFLKGDKSLLEEIDYVKDKKNCSLEKWKFDKESLVMVTYNKSNCNESKTDMKYSIKDNNFYFLYPSMGSFILNPFVFTSFTTQQLIIREEGEYIDLDVESLNYHKGTKFVQYVFER